MRRATPTLCLNIYITCTLENQAVDNFFASFVGLATLCSKEDETFWWDRAVVSSNCVYSERSALCLRCLKRCNCFFLTFRKVRDHHIWIGCSTLLVVGNGTNTVEPSILVPWIITDSKQPGQTLTLLYEECCGCWLLVWPGNIASISLYNKSRSSPRGEVVIFSFLLGERQEELVLISWKALHWV